MELLFGVIIGTMCLVATGVLVLKALHIRAATVDTELRIKVLRREEYEREMRGAAKVEVLRRAGK
jgi:hypothetical protein